MGYATPYEQQFKQGQILKLARWDEGATLPAGSLVVLAADDETSIPYFTDLKTGEDFAVALHRLVPATYQEIKAVELDYELKVGDTVRVVVDREWRHWTPGLDRHNGKIATVKSIDDDGDYQIEGDPDRWNFEGAALMNEETETQEETPTVTKQTPFQAAGYTADTVFITDRDRRVQLRRDDGTECPFFNKAGTQDYHGVEYLEDLTVEVVDGPKEEPTEGAVEDNSLEGLIVLVRGARSELARVEALLAAKTEELGITIVIEASTVETLGEVITDGEQMYRQLSVNDRVKIELKPGLANDDEWDLDKVYSIERVDRGDTYRPIHFTERSEDDTLWLRSGLYNVRKVS